MIGISLQREWSLTDCVLIPVNLANISVLMSIINECACVYDICSSSLYGKILIDPGDTGLVFIYIYIYISYMNDPMTEWRVLESWTKNKQKKASAGLISLCDKKGQKPVMRWFHCTTARRGKRYGLEESIAGFPWCWCWTMQTSASGFTAFPFWGHRVCMPCMRVFLSVHVGSRHTGTFTRGLRSTAPRLARLGTAGLMGGRGKLQYSISCLSRLWNTSPLRAWASRRLRLGRLR